MTCSIEYQSVRKVVATNEIDIASIQTEDNVPDIIVKFLPGGDGSKY
jgi:hypothetical protein